ncbi:bud site selection protein 20 [Scheffersomyces amazonensis]|uniref:bud site selection protein 20 n=1 Tax=Scheffersomyces amazonensis TaxID=1078765 RepID=UPI00315C5672
MGRYSVKRYKTKRRTRDLDLIYDDISSKESIIKLKNQPLDEDKPGLGQYYCVQCAKYFENQLTLDRHTKAKVHKRRVKELKQRPYTNLESEAASGVNMLKFIESVEKYKQLEQFKKDNETEFEALANQKKDNLDAIITGVPSEEFQKKAEGTTEITEVETQKQALAEDAEMS